jgi:phosphatidylglycerol lysyltransferase
MKYKILTKLNLIGGLAVISGLITLSSTLEALVRTHKARIVLADAHLTVIAGVSLIYLATLLRRGKYNAWLISLPIYGYLMVRNYRHFTIDMRADQHFVAAALNLLLPCLMFVLLIAYREVFNVRSESRSFALAAQRSTLILLVAFLYGLVGFSLMDEHDFHQEVSTVSAAHYTLDQFGLTTTHQITTYSKRANLFLDSLGAVSVAAVFYTAVSFFAPIRFRLHHSQKDYLDSVAILRKHSVTSEDFFKLWPNDKSYFFSKDRKAFIAYRVVSGVALTVGDPVGSKLSIKSLIQQFLEYCRINDWSPAFVHTDSRYLKAYEAMGMNAQKLGEEAIVRTEHFNNKVATNKYFRHIKNKFGKAGYRCQKLIPPHSPEIMARLKQISDEWLNLPGRLERGFMMGYFTGPYMQNCELMVLCDQEGEIQAFLNMIPAYRRDEASYDILRSAATAPTNTIDYLMLNYIDYVGKQGYSRLNMGFAPLTGLDPKSSEDRSTIDGLLHFVYDNADRFYSFQGLARFKSKYEPEWESRYIIYRGNLPSFGRSMTALIKAMKR